MTSFDSAARKLTAEPTPYPLEDLPTDSNDELWQEIRTTYGLSLPELAALKNYERRQEFNGQTLLQRKELRALFEQQQQQDGKLHCCLCILVFPIALYST